MAGRVHLIWTLKKTLEGGSEEERKKVGFFLFSFIFFEEGVKPGVTLSLSVSCWDHKDEEGEFDLQQTLILT